MKRQRVYNIHSLLSVILPEKCAISSLENVACSSVDRATEALAISVPCLTKSNFCLGILMYDSSTALVIHEITYRQGYPYPTIFQNVNFWKKIQ